MKLVIFSEISYDKAPTERGIGDSTFVRPRCRAREQRRQKEFM